MSPPSGSSRHVVVRGDSVRERAGVLAILSEQTRKGDWAMPRYLRVACVLGSAVIDLREARIPDGASTLEVYCLFGSVEVLLPPGVRVEVEGDTLAGQFSFEPDPTVRNGLDAPTVRIVGSAYFANVEASVRQAGEDKRAAKRRLKAAARGRDTG